MIWSTNDLERADRDFVHAQIFTSSGSLGSTIGGSRGSSIRDSWCSSVVSAPIVGHLCIEFLSSLALGSNTLGGSSLFLAEKQLDLSCRPWQQPWSRRPTWVLPLGWR